MKEILFIAACIAVSFGVSIFLVECERNQVFMDCLKRGTSAEICESVL